MPQDCFSKITEPIWTRKDAFLGFLSILRLLMKRILLKTNQIMKT